MPLCTHPLSQLMLPGTFPDSVLLLRNFRKTEKSPIILRPTRESNPRPLAQQSHLQPLGHRGSLKCLLNNLLTILSPVACVYKLRNSPTYHTQTRSNNLRMTQRFAPCGNRIHYTAERSPILKRMIWNDM
ncbi:hypothetical protein SFRURICE_017735, partial [Spodoptera frugiperda]